MMITGRPRKLTHPQQRLVLELYERGYTKLALANLLGVHRNAITRIIKNPRKASAA